MAKKTLTVTKATVPEAKKDLLVKLGQLAENNYQMQLWVKDIVDDLPEEQLLESAVFVPEFAWSAASYPGSTDPSKEGKPVLVLAFKTYEGLDVNEPKITYSFIDMSALADIYEADNTGKKAVSLAVDEYKIAAQLILHTATGEEKPNALSIDATDGGAYVPDLSGDIDDINDEIGAYTVPAVPESSEGAGDGTPAVPGTGMKKKIEDNEIKIGSPNTADEGDPSNATGLYKLIEDAKGEITGQFSYATDTDIQSLFE